MEWKGALERGGIHTLLLDDECHSELREKVVLSNNII